MASTIRVCCSGSHMVAGMRTMHGSVHFCAPVLMLECITNLPCIADVLVVSPSSAGCIVCGVRVRGITPFFPLIVLIEV